MKTLAARLLLVCSLAIMTAGAGYSANNRPLLYGMNPTPTEWWGYDRNIWDPLLFQKMAEAGCTVARIGVNWDTIEPVQGQRDFSEIDRWVKLCLDNNIEPLLLINSTPPWALPANIDPLVSVPEARYPPDIQYAEVFNQWVYDLVRRYRGQARYYEFWNEANGYGWYTALQNPPTYGRADLYTPWMIRAYRAVKLADPTSMMSTTGIDDGGPTGHAAGFLEGIYNYGGQGYFDAVADHPYPIGGQFQSFKMDAIRNTLDARGDHHVKVWITEYGYPMNPNNYPAYQTYLADYFNQLTQDKYDYVRIATWHTANEFPWEFGYGLMNSNLTPKPPYTTFKNYPKPSRPQISAVSATPLSATSARINFTTNMASRALVMYGKTSTYGQMTARGNVPVTQHQILLEGLEPGTSYRYRIRAGAVEDGDAFSQEFGFTTPSGQAVVITQGPAVSNITDVSATITWNTNVPSSGQVELGPDFAYGTSIPSLATGTTHTVTVGGLAPNKVYQFRVRSSAAGYATAVKEGPGYRTQQAMGQLVNGSFEQGSSGWTFWEVYPWGNGAPDYPGRISVYSNGGWGPPTPAAKDGQFRITLDVGYASAVGGLYQTVNAPNGMYLVSGWVAAATDASDEIIELIAQDGNYTGGIPTGTRIASITQNRGWEYYSGIVDVTTGRLTIALRVSQYYAFGAVAGHFDGIRVDRLQSGNLSNIKQQAAGRAVITDNVKTVTAVIDSNTFYMQEPDRSSGIRVRTTGSHGQAPGRRVHLHGFLNVVNGEAVIENAKITSSGAGTVPKAMGITLASLGGEASGVQQGTQGSVGLSNTGLLVRAWGKASQVDSTSFMLDDGSGEAVLCRMISGTVGFDGKHVELDGISSCELMGGELKPVLLVKTILKQNP